MRILKYTIIFVLVFVACLFADMLINDIRSRKIKENKDYAATVEPTKTPAPSPSPSMLEVSKETKKAADDFCNKLQKNYDKDDLKINVHFYPDSGKIIEYCYSENFIAYIKNYKKGKINLKIQKSWEEIKKGITETSSLFPNVTYEMKLVDKEFTLLIRALNGEILYDYFLKGEL